jgi:hypothetical protein
VGFVEDMMAAAGEFKAETGRRRRKKDDGAHGWSAFL